MRSENKPRMRRLKQPLLLMLAVCFVLVSILSIGAKAESRINESQRSEDYRTWAQGDPRWTDLPMGTSGKTVGSIGCLVTSVTKLIIQGGYRNSSSFNVATLVTWLNSNDGITSSGNLVWAKPAEMIDGMEFYGMDFTAGSSSSSSTQNRIMNYVRAGHQVTLNVKNGGHWVAIDNDRSLQEDEVYIMDSLNDISGNADVTLTSRYSYVNRICMFIDSALIVPDPTEPPSPSPEPGYIDQCDCEPVSVRARVTAQSATLYTQPCTSGNGSTAAGTAANGSMLELSAQVVNTLGENWYRVESGNDQQSFISGRSIEFAGFLNDLQIVPYDPPSGSLPNGSGYPLNESVISRHRLTSITGRFTDRDGNVIKSVTLNPNTRGLFSVSSSQINSQLRFGELAVGHYNYELIAEVTADSNMTSETKTFGAVFVSPFSIGTSALETHTVSFVDSITGETISTQTAAHGFYPVPVDAPEHEGFTFSHWEGAGQRVYADMRITARYTSDTIVPGDADGNGAITVADAITVLRYTIGLIGENGGIIISAADINGDGSITITDALMVIRLAIT